MVLKAIASIFLVLLIVTRAVALFWPKKVKGWMKDITKINKNWSYLLSLVMFATGLIISLLVIRLVNLQTFLTSSFGLALLAGGFLVYDGMYRDAIKIFLKKSDKWIQKVALLKVVVAAILLYLLMY